MKIKDTICLHDVETMKEFLENNKIIGATDAEVQAFIDVFEGHGYYLHARDMKDNMFARVDTCVSNEDLEEIDIDNEEYVTFNTIHYELSYAYEMLCELYREEYNEDEYEQAFDSGVRANLVSDLYSRYLDKDKDKIYIVSYSSRSNFSTIDDNTVEVFYNEVDAYKDIKDSLEFTIEHNDVEQDIHDNTDFSNEIEVKKYMIDYRERDEFLLMHDSGSLQINLAIDYKDEEEVDHHQEEPKMEFYTLVDHYTRFDFYEDSVEVKHYKNKEEGLKEFNDLVEEYKDSWNIEEIGEFDDINEYENDNIKYFSLYINEQVRIELSLEKVVL